MGSYGSYCADQLDKARATISQVNEPKGEQAMNCRNQDRERGFCPVFSGATLCVLAAAFGYGLARVALVLAGLA